MPWSQTSSDICHTCFSVCALSLSYTHILLMTCTAFSIQLLYVVPFGDHRSQFFCVQSLVFPIRSVAFIFQYHFVSLLQCFSLGPLLFIVFLLISFPVNNRFLCLLVTLKRMKLQYTRDGQELNGVLAYSVR